MFNICVALKKSLSLFMCCYNWMISVFWHQSQGTFLRTAYLQVGLDCVFLLLLNSLTFFKRDALWMCGVNDKFFSVSQSSVKNSL